MQRWTVHLEGGPRRVNHAAVAIGQRIYSFGGYCTGEDYETTRPIDVYILNTLTYRWILLPLPSRDDPQYACIPYLRYGHTCVAYNECAYLWGGRNDTDGACNILYCFDASENKWSRVKVNGITPGARDGHSACVIYDKMYIFGGYEEPLDRFSNEVHALDFNTMTWSLIPATGTPARWRDFHSATAIGDNMYIYGGRSDKAGPHHTNHELYQNEMMVFNTTTCSWHEIDSSGLLPIGRRSHSAFVYNNKIYIFGGYNGVHEVHFDDLYMFDPGTASNKWSFVKVKGSGPQPRRRQCCCVINNKAFLFGGTCPKSSPLEPGESPETELIDQSDLHVLDFAPTLKTLCQLEILRYDMDRSCLPKMLRMETAAMTTNNTISRPLNSSG